MANIFWKTKLPFGIFLTVFFFFFLFLKEQKQVHYYEKSLQEMQSGHMKNA